MSVSNFFSLPFLLGFETFQTRIEEALKKHEYCQFPPYNILKKNEHHLQLLIAVAGFEKQELSIIHKQNSLIIKGKKQPKSHRTYLYNGITNQEFNHYFFLMEGSKPNKAILKTGILKIDILLPAPSTQNIEIDIIEEE